MPWTSGTLSVTIQNAEREIERLSRQHCGDAKVFSFGATDIDPRHLAIWIITTTDYDRDLLRANQTLLSEFDTALLNVGYPPEAVPNVGFAFESQETVDCDHKGNWWYAVK
jgi:hypothetical protein